MCIRDRFLGGSGDPNKFSLVADEGALVPDANLMRVAERLNALAEANNANNTRSASNRRSISSFFVCERVNKL